MSNITLLTVRDVAALLRIGRSTLYRYMHEDGFPRPIQVLGVKRWRSDDLQAWILAQKHAA